MKASEYRAMKANPEPYNERVRLAEIITDARELLAEPSPRGPYAREAAPRIGKLEAMLKMLADSAEIVAGDG